MNRLPEVIGPAPSEVSLVDLLPRLRQERQRVQKGLDAFAAGIAPSWKELRDKNWKQKRADKAAKAAKKKPRKKRAPKAPPSKAAAAEQLTKLLESGALPLEKLEEILAARKEKK